MKWGSFLAIVALMGLLFSGGHAWACQDEVRSELKSARTLLFYAMSTSNSRVELDQAQVHLDEAARLLATCAHSDLQSDLESVQRDLDSRREIASENLNYQLPLYDVMFGHRRDFNTVDDHDEVLIEDLCARILEQPSDVRAQWSVPAVHSWVVFKRPASTELHNVAIEYLSENSGMYVLQLMEYPEAYFAQPDSGQVPFTQEGYAKLAARITAKFGLKQLYLFAFDEKGKIEDLELQYTGGRRIWPISFSIRRLAPSCRIRICMPRISIHSIVKEGFTTIIKGGQVGRMYRKRWPWTLIQTKSSPPSPPIKSIR